MTIALLANSIRQNIYGCEGGSGAPRRGPKQAPWRHNVSVAAGVGNIKPAQRMPRAMGDPIKGRAARMLQAGLHSVPALLPPRDLVCRRGYVQMIHCPPPALCRLIDGMSAKLSLGTVVLSADRAAERRPLDALARL